jgi:hypothetical protein
MSNAGSGELGGVQIPGSMESVGQSPACKPCLLAEKRMRFEPTMGACGSKVLLGDGAGLA